MENTDTPDWAWQRAWQEERRRTGIMGETSKARPRRLREGWFARYAPEDQPGIDIGCADDPLNHTFRRFDFIFGDGDATAMPGVPDGLFQTVYCSHVLEHLKYPAQAIRRWHALARPGGHVVVCVPHRDLYEKRRFPPSQFNHEHAYFWLPDAEEPPGVKSLRGEILRAVPGAAIVSLRVLDDGYGRGLGPEEHPVGEYSIEAIIKKSAIAS